MSATIRTTCHACGTVEIPVLGAQLHLPMPGGDLRTELRFRCPRCGDEQRQRVGERAMRLLSRAGITLMAPVPTEVPATGATADEGISRS